MDPQWSETSRQNLSRGLEGCERLFQSPWDLSFETWIPNRAGLSGNRRRSHRLVSSHPEPCPCLSIQCCASLKENSCHYWEDNRYVQEGIYYC